jgi:hypothetical protein
VNDPTLYRVTLFCPCDNDYAEGYGPTKEQARESAYSFYRRDHKKEVPREEIVEKAVPHEGGGSHYEEASQ